MVWSMKVPQEGFLSSFYEYWLDVGNQVLSCHHEFYLLEQLSSQNLDKMQADYNCQEFISQATAGPPVTEKPCLSLGSNSKIFTFKFMNYTPGWLQQTSQKMTQKVVEQGYNKIVIQLPASLVSHAFLFVQQIRSRVPTADTYILHDSLKNSCCLDIIGASHVNYDCLFHLGPACFSSPHQPNHHYIFDPPRDSARISSGQLIKEVQTREIRYLLVEQEAYFYWKDAIRISQVLKSIVELLVLPFDADHRHQYLFFGYHMEKKSQSEAPKNILMIPSAPDSKFIDHVSLSFTSLTDKLGSKLYCLHADSHIRQAGYSEILSKRYSLISKIDKCITFGVIICNTMTAFRDSALNMVRKILQGKKQFTFMMNNLNEVKLGNFPQIEAYVIISCYHHSLFSFKDYHHLVVTPYDLLVALRDYPLDGYSIDLNDSIFKSVELKEGKQTEEMSEVVQPLQSGQLMLQSKIQALDFYREREYKGLQFVQLKEVSKAKKGKIGLATEYSKIK